MDLTKYNEPFSSKSNSNIGVLVIHGFTSTTSSMLYIAENLAAAGFNVELPSLPGHGTKWQDLCTITYQDWLDHLDSSLEILRSRTDNIFLCGLSLGGALALRLAERFSDLSGLILINHTIIFTHPKFWFVPLIKRFIKSTPAIASDIKDPTFKEIGYKRTPTEGVYQMMQLHKEVIKDLHNINQPVLFFRSRIDHLVPKRSTTFTIDRINSKQKELIWLENSYHVATLDFDKDLIIEKSITFINKNSNK
jgi:carboxylesterase